MTKTVIALHDSRAPLAIPGAAPLDGRALADTMGRQLRDLRISVTDRCNFRCTYCMPREVFDAGYSFLPHDELLSFEEIVRLARVFAALGTRKIRLTGGEPLLRKNIDRLVAMLREALPGIDLTLTTNGSALKAYAPALRAAGLDRVTVSLDSLDDATFRAMNDADFPVAKVLEGIEAASAAGLGPIKVNMVVKRGVNDDQVVEMARHFRGSGHIVRFIEFMDVGSTNGWRMDDVMPSAEIVARISAQFPLAPGEPNYAGEVAERWRYLDGRGEIGLISSVTQAFCSSCTRARLSTDGQLYTCLFAQRGYDLKALLRSNADDEGLQRAVTGIWQRRGDRYSEVRTAETARSRKVEMSFIGG
ncbi:MAG TPA: GTP 3',8-cyclase MoaA [Usitatibacter sp.]|nr:GTP 3',8-cyclase MoaA [Usitatibacter sp.]